MAFAYMYFNLMDGKIIVYMRTCIYTCIVTVDILENLMYIYWLANNTYC